MQNTRLDKAQAGVKIAERNINNLRCADDTTVMAESEEELKNLLMKVKEKSEKAGIKLNVQKTKIIASSPITSWQIDGEKWKQWQILYSWAPKLLSTVIAAMKLKDAPWKKSYDKHRQHIKELVLLLLLSRFSRVRLCATPQTAAHQAPPCLGFSRQEHWSGLPFPSPMHQSEKSKWSRSVVSDSSRPHGLQSTRLLCPWDFPGKSTGVSCHCLLLLKSCCCCCICWQRSI